MGFNLLKHAIHEHQKTSCSDILNQVNLELSEVLNQKLNESSVRDGMDLALCCLHKDTLELEYSGANNSIYVASNNQLTEYKANKQPIGAYVHEELKPFTSHKIKVNKGDIVYLFTDGYADQFGGPKHKKFKYKQFEETIQSILKQPLAKQKTLLNTQFNEWRGEVDQLDDVLVMGIKI